jgi:hypothetical protein
MKVFTPLAALAKWKKRATACDYLEQPVEMLVGYCWTLWSQCQLQAGGCDHAAAEANFQKEASNQNRRAGVGCRRINFPSRRRIGIGRTDG